MEKIVLTEMEMIQKSARDILKQVHEFCNKYDIKYTLWGGSLIGAIRHNGFIPWDDDVDIAMERSEYDRFIELFIKHQNEHPDLFLQTPETDDYYFFSFAKIRDLTTKGQEAIHINMPFKEGVFLDVFPIEVLPKDNLKKERKFGRKAIFLEMLLTIKIAFKFPPKRTQKLLMWAIYLLAFVPLIVSIIVKHPLAWIVEIPFTIFALLMSYIIFVPYKRLVRRRDRHLVKYKNEKSDYIGKFSTMKPPQYRMPKQWFEEVTTMTFDGIEVSGTKHYHAMLTQLFGDYMKLPPEDKRYGQHAYIGLKTKYNKDL